MQGVPIPHQPRGPDKNRHKRLSAVGAQNGPRQSGFIKLALSVRGQHCSASAGLSGWALSTRARASLITASLELIEARDLEDRGARAPGSPSADAARPAPSHAYQPPGSRAIAWSNRCSSGRVLTDLERDRAADAPRIGAQGIELGGDAKIVERLGRVAVAEVGGDRHLANRQVREAEHDHGRRAARVIPAARGQDAPPRDRRGAALRTRAARRRRYAAGSSDPPAAGAASDAARRPRARPPPPGTRAPARSARASPRTSRSSRGSASRPAAAAPRPRRTPRARARRRAGIAAAIAATRNVANSAKPTSPVCASSRSSRLWVYEGSVVGPPARNVVVVEVVLSEATDRMRDERIERDPPEVVAPAADVGEVRARRRPSGRG